MTEQDDTFESSTYVVDDQMGFILRVATQFHTAIFLSRMVGNLTQTQFGVLIVVYQLGTCSQSDLGRSLQLDSATINGVVDRLKTRGLIELSEDSTDRRKQHVTLTAEGEVLVREALPVAKEITAATVANLTAAERERLIKLLRKMVATPQPVVSRKRR